MFSDCFIYYQMDFQAIAMLSVEELQQLGMRERGHNEFEAFCRNETSEKTAGLCLFWRMLQNY